MSDVPFLAILSIGTLVIVLGYAVYHLKKVRQSQHKRGEHPGGMAGPEPGSEL